MLQTETRFPRPHSVHEVVITGVGVVSPIGVGRDAFWGSVCATASGVRSIRQLAGGGLTAAFGGVVDGFEPKRYVRPRKSLKVMSREIQFAFAAASMAWDDAGLGEANLLPERLGVVCGSDMLYSEPADQESTYRKCIEGGKFDFDRWGEHAFKEIYPLWMLKYLPNMIACHISISHDLRGPCNSIVLGDVSSLLAVAEGYRVIRRGTADCMVVGGAGSRLHLTPIVWRGEANLSRRNDTPEAACRPFDADRDGIVNGEGAGMLVLENRAHAERRGAKILGRVAGAGSSFGVGPAGLGATSAAIRRSINAALEVEKIEPDRIGHVSAHGLSTREDDAAEAQAIRQTLADVPVTATKSLFGNLGAGSGAVELIASVLGMANGCIPSTRNYETPDNECPIEVVTGEPRQARHDAMIALNQSRLGQTAAVVVAAE